MATQSQHSAGTNLEYPHLSQTRDQYYWRRQRPHLLSHLTRATGMTDTEVARKLAGIAYDMPIDAAEQSVISRFHTLYS